jgi:3-dehydroquinate synthase II
MKKLWLRADVPDDANLRKKLMISGLEAGIDTFVIRPGDEALSSLGKVNVIVNNNGNLGGYVNGKAVRVTTPDEQTVAMKLCGKEKVLMVSTGDWSVIPFENLIAASAGRTEIIACVSSADEAELCRNILEKGTDGIAIDVTKPNAIKAIAESANKMSSLGLIPIKVTKIRNINTGDRICIDTCSTMIPGEGMLIGSQASCLFLVQSESEENGYVAARPFRVNAGAVHAYIMMPDGKTKYLSELGAGDDILIVDRKGDARTGSIGRCKNELRPMVIVTAVHNGEEYTTVLQNAETVKLVTPKGSVSVSELKKGDDVLVLIAEGGRHFGMAVKEKIRES